MSEEEKQGEGVAVAEAAAGAGGAEGGRGAADQVPSLESVLEKFRAKDGGEGEKADAAGEAGAEGAGGEAGAEGAAGEGGEKGKEGAAGAVADTLGVEGATEEDAKGLPADVKERPARAALIHARVQERRLNEQLKAKEAELAQFKAGHDPAGLGEEKGPRKKEDPLTQETQVFELRAKAKRVLDGEVYEGWDEARANEVMRLADGIKSGMDDEGRALAIIERARRGEFGELSDIIKADAERELPLIQARSRQRERQESAKTAELEKVKSAVAEKLTAWQEKNPAFKEFEPGKESPEVKFCQVWMKKHVVGEDGKPGRRYAELIDPEAVEGLMSDMMDAFRAQKFDALVKENQALKRSQQRHEAPLGGVGGPSEGGGGDPKPGSPEALAAILGKYKK